MRSFVHKKTKNIYYHLYDATEVTNGREGINVVVYTDSNRKNVYVREKQEFEQKFEISLENYIVKKDK